MMEFQDETLAVLYDEVELFREDFIGQTNYNQMMKFIDLFQITLMAVDMLNFSNKIRKEEFIDFHDLLHRHRQGLEKLPIELRPIDP